MRREYAGDPRVQFLIGDVRDRDRVAQAMVDIDIAINAAALKHIPICEEAPTEAILTNVIGAVNVRQQALAAGVRTVVCISTDKAVKPINVLGMTKALQERIMLAPEPIGSRTQFLCVRYGNVIGSSGSVVPLFHRQILNGEPITLTNTEMTRFLLTLDEAVDAVFTALEHGASGEIWVRRSPAIRIVELVRAMAVALTGKQDYETVTIGMRPGEKIHELLVSAEEMPRTLVHGDYFRIQPVHAERIQTKLTAEFSSESTSHVNTEKMRELLSIDGWS